MFVQLFGSHCSKGNINPLSLCLLSEYENNGIEKRVDASGNFYVNK